MLISCPACAARYRLDPARSRGKRMSIRCPGCQFVFPVHSAQDVGSQGVKVLLATGNPDMARALEALCLRSQLSCRICSDGTEAIRQLATIHPATVLLDVALTGRYAFEVIDFIRQQPKGEQVRILLLTSSFRTRSFIAQTRELHGADDSIAFDRLAAMPLDTFESYLTSAGSPPGASDEREERNQQVDEKPELSPAQWNQATNLAKVIAADIVLRYQDLLEESARTGVLGKALVQGLAKGRELFSARMGEDVAAGYDFVGAALAACLQGRLGGVDSEAE